jgi:hypothetical protein
VGRKDRPELGQRVFHDCVRAIKSGQRERGGGTKGQAGYRGVLWCLRCLLGAG